MQRNAILQKLLDAHDTGEGGSESMKIGVTVTHTLNMGDYGSIRPGMYVEDDVSDGESVEATYKRVSSTAHKFWATECNVQLREHVVTRKKIEKSSGG